APGTGAAGGNDDLRQEEIAVRRRDAEADFVGADTGTVGEAVVRPRHVGIGAPRFGFEEAGQLVFVDAEAAHAVSADVRPLPAAVSSTIHAVGSRGASKPAR